MNLILFALFAFLAWAKSDDDEMCGASRAKPSPSYSYFDNAATKWHTLKPEYSLCASGSVQSPINVITDTYTNDSVPTFEQHLSIMKYGPDSNNFHWSCENKFGSCGKLVVSNSTSNTTSTLLQVHPHSPSENLIDGIRYPLELHFVHSTEDGSLSVLGVLFREGRKNRELQHLLDAAYNRHYAVVDVPVLSDVVNSDMCTFDGSLTTPPCKEDVRWYVSLNVQEASLAQIGRYRQLCGETPNSRPVQKTNFRSVKCYGRGRRKV